MTGTRDPLATAPDDIRLLASELATVSGTLCEVATTWRRARAYRPDLPPGLPQRLADTARQLAADIQLLTGAAAREESLPPSLARQMSALREDVTAARAMTHGPGDPGVGDTGLWDSLAPVLSF